MKKNILFAIDSLEVAGAEKSLVTLLNMIDSERYNIDLLLFAHGGSLEKLVPKSIHVLPPLKYTEFSKLPILKSLISSFRKREFKMLLARLSYSTKIRMNKYSNPEKARLFWESISPVLEPIRKTYDIAISYAQGVPTFYVAEKVNAKQKFAWVNVSYRLNTTEKDFQKQFYRNFNNIVAVSHSANEVFKEVFPEFSGKMKVIFDINNPEIINNMAEFEAGYNDDFKGIKILTIGRHAKQKGYDIAIEACRILRDKGINFRWYSLGKGPLTQDIKDQILEYKLENHFILLGVHENPYPFIKQSDIYVQPSRYEGFGLAIAEARMLNIPVVATSFDAVHNQMLHEKNGLIVDMDADSVADGILRLIDDELLKQKIITYLRQEKKGNVEELSKFNDLIS